MERLIEFAFIAAVISCAVLAQAGSSAFKQNAARPKTELPAPAAHPAPLPFQILKPLY
jgi:hypothetical protein